MEWTESSRIFDTLRTELGDRAFNDLADENASPWNTTYEVYGRWLETQVPPASYPEQVVAA